MGSSKGVIGYRGGETLYTFTATGQDTGSMLYNDHQLPGGWKTHLFQLVGTGVGWQVTLYGTIDKLTAENLGSEWVPLPAPSIEATAYSWANPLISDGQDRNGRACAVTGPFIAFRAVSSAAITAPGGTPTGSVTLRYVGTE